MKTTIKIKEKLRVIDLTKPLDISLPLKSGRSNPMAWYQEAPSIQPVKEKKWIAKVTEGAAINFNRIQFAPHAHGTHTECVGHITPEFYSVNDCLKHYFFLAEVITLVPEDYMGDRVFSKKQLEHRMQEESPEALVIRTLPNTRSKRTKKYDHTNWPYFLEEAALWLRECGIKHLLVDLPSIDREEDHGQLLAHRAFWNYPEAPRMESTITELIYVPARVKDGLYILNLQLAPFHNNASPSKPVLYSIQ
ncbi:cyclase family protein [Croceiramulus getboli]|nr:cyclase family protein [Flavobacteriaceae bacterium YJPT1-3]